MKYTSKKYAQALANAIVEGNLNDKKITDNFLMLLQKNQDIKKASQILALTEELLLKKTGNKKVTIETARKTDTKNFMKTFVKKGDVVEEKINPALVAGLKIIVNDNQQLDVSLKNKLENIF